MTENSSKGALAGLLVVDLSQNLPGPYCSRLLADQGARVIKVEPATKYGDFARGLPEFYRILNAGKESLTVDLKTEEGRNIIHALAKKADVFIESFRPGVVKRLGVDYETLSGINKKLVYCSISGYGQSGEISKIPAHDINLQAMAGLIGFTGRRERDSGEECSIPIADMVTSLYAHSAIVSALLAQKTTKQGAYIDMPMADGIAHMVHTWQPTTPTAAMLEQQLAKTKLPKALQHLAFVRRPLEKFATRGVLPALPHYGVFTCSDGKRVCLGIVDEMHFWKTLCEEMGGGLQRFAKLKPMQRALLYPVLKMQLKHGFKRHTSVWWYQQLAEKHNIPLSMVVSSDKLLETPYFAAKLVGTILPSPLAAADHVAQDAAELGQDNERILAELNISAPKKLA